MNTLATASTSGERYANECSMCLQASLPDAGELGPTGGTSGKSPTETQKEGERVREAGKRVGRR